eukprot:8014820-Pyramimonas_sp.AAC.1
MAQQAPKTASRRPRTAPRRPKRSSKRPKRADLEGGGRARDERSTAGARFGGGPEGPGRAQHCRDERFQCFPGPRGPPDALRRPQEASKTAHAGL